MQKVMAAIQAQMKLSELRGMLKLLQVLKTTSSYVPVAKALGLFSGSAKFAALLGETQEEDLANDEPFRSSLIVGSTTGIPGVGYFANARRLGCQIGTNPHDEFMFWFSQMLALKVPIPTQAGKIPPKPVPPPRGSSRDRNHLGLKARSLSQRSGLWCIAGACSTTASAG